MSTVSGNDTIIYLLPGLTTAQRRAALRRAAAAPAWATAPGCRPPASRARCWPTGCAPRSGTSPARCGFTRALRPADRDHQLRGRCLHPVSFGASARVHVDRRPAAGERSRRSRPPGRRAAAGNPAAGPGAASDRFGARQVRPADAGADVARCAGDHPTGPSPSRRRPARPRRPRAPPRRRRLPRRRYGRSRPPRRRRPAPHQRGRDRRQRPVRRQPVCLDVGPLGACPSTVGPLAPFRSARPIASESCLLHRSDPGLRTLRPARVADPGWPRAKECQR